MVGGPLYATAGVWTRIRRFFRPSPGGRGILFYGWLWLRSESGQLASERVTLQQRKDDLEKQSSEQRIEVEQLRAELQRTLGQQG